MKITQEEINQVEYNDLVISELKTDSQRYAIEKAEQTKSIIKRKQVMKQVKKEPSKLYLNHLMTSKLESDITDEEKNREQEWAEMGDFNI